ncbi:MAG: UbiH/UbiF/VisC/COQ6 family ubiquinone biosynthesis hydroxylase [Rickettsiales bacterium]|nr:UbiH/UbiF/VisC/COQ6 family ubiquinone biosynthesis hydroxylase [Rickettsiales bacterium]
MSDRHPEHSEVLIVGGGLIGTAMSIALSQRGVQVRVLERASQQSVFQPRHDGRVSAISQASARVFRHLGVWDALAPHGEPILDIRVADEGSTAHVHFDHASVGDAPFGYMIPNTLIRQTLQTAMEAQSRVSIVYDADIASVNNDTHRARLVLKDAQRYSADLLLVADGRHSTLRDMLGIKARVFDYDQVAIVCTISHAQPHHGVAVELFQPAGPLAILPMTEQRSCVVWTESTMRAETIMALSAEDFTARLAAAMGGYLGDIELLAAPYAYPLHLVQAQHYTATRTALIGDAAHGIHPIAGQGVNLGYRDVAVMSDLLEDAKALGLDIGSQTLLDHYQRWRRFDANAMMATTDLLNRLFSNNLSTLRAIRRVGLSVFNRVSPLKHWFMLSAMGLKGDLPRMLRD